MFTAVNMYTNEAIGSLSTFGLWMTYAQAHKLPLIVTSARTGKKCNIFVSAQLCRRTRWY